MSADIRPIGCTGNCSQGRQCDCLPDLESDTWGEPVETPVPWWEAAMFWTVVGTLAVVIVGGWGWMMGWWL